MRRGLLALGALVLLLVPIVALFVVPRHYPGRVVKVRISYSGQGLSEEIDLWYDPHAQLLRSTIAHTRLTVYLHCPPAGRCSAARSGAAPVQVVPRWTDLLAAYLPRLPARHQAGKLDHLGDHQALFYDLPYPQAPQMHRQLWLDPRSGMPLFFRETAAGLVVLRQYFATTILPAGTLPADFFQAPAASSTWTERLGTLLARAWPW